MFPGGRQACRCNGFRGREPRNGWIDAYRRGLCSEKGGSDLKLFAGTLVVKAELWPLSKNYVHSKWEPLQPVWLRKKKRHQDLGKKEMAVFAKNVAVIGIFLCVLIVVVYYGVKGKFVASHSQRTGSGNGYPAGRISRCILPLSGHGCMAIGWINVLTRQPSVIEALGSASVLCSDKTGTITQNKMVVAMVFDGSKLTPATPQMDSEYKL